MKPLLSDNGSVELGIGLILATAGISWYAFPARGIPGPFEGPGPFGSGVLLAIGINGLALRKASRRL